MSAADIEEALREIMETVDQAGHLLAEHKAGIRNAIVDTYEHGNHSDSTGEHPAHPVQHEKTRQSITWFPQGREPRTYWKPRSEVSPAANSSREIDASRRRP